MDVATPNSSDAEFDQEEKALAGPPADQPVPSQTPVPVRARSPGPGALTAVVPIAFSSESEESEFGVGAQSSDEGAQSGDQDTIQAI